MNGSGPIVLAILDGWGIAPPSRGNAVTLASTPILRRWATTYPHTQLQAGGPAVGLALGQDGNSEAGHMNLGAGRVVIQENVRISQNINDGTFFRNPAFLAALRHVQKRSSTLHLVGMLGNNQSAHADPDHLLALLMFCQTYRLRRVKLHLFTDGRDSPRFLAREILSKFMAHLGDVSVATIMGRFYGMDRNKTWTRTALAYQAMTLGQADHHVDDPLEAISQAYNRGESDEFIRPTVVGTFDGIHDGDVIIHFNLRSDRARQLTKTFVQPDFEQRNAATHAFTRPRIVRDLLFVAMTDFGPDLGDILTAYPAIQLHQTLPMVLHDQRQLYIAESEKYAHVTYFFNGGYADPVGGEERVMIPSPDVRTYDQAPAMSSQALTDRVIQAITQRTHDVIVMNYANTDMVAHTGVLSAGIAAMEATDGCLGRLEQAVLAADGILVVTGDHGNLEEMINLKTDEIDTEHSSNPVPLYLLSNNKTHHQLRPDGALGDVAPTMLALMKRPQPAEMTGRSVLLV